MYSSSAKACTKPRTWDGRLALSRNYTNDMMSRINREFVDLDTALDYVESLGSSGITVRLRLRDYLPEEALLHSEELRQQLQVEGPP